MTTTHPTTHGESDDIPATNWKAVIVAASAIVLVALDMAIVAVALPVVGAEFDASPSVTQWVMLAYFLPMVALGIPVGRWIDRAQIRAAYFFAVSGYGVTSLVVMVAPTIETLIGSRALQGIFAALVAVLGFPVIATSVRAEHRGRAMGVILTFIPLSGMVGPALGGTLAENYGWRPIFAVSLPIVLLAMWLGHRAIPSGARGQVALPIPDRHLVSEALVLGGAVGALMLGLTLLGENPGQAAFPAALGAFTVLAAAAWTRLPASRPVTAFLRQPRVGLMVVSLMFMTSGFAATNFLMPYFFIEIFQRSATMAGLVLLALGLAMATISPLAGVLADRYGYWPVLLTGGMITLSGAMGIFLLGTDPHPLDVAWRLALIGTGQGLFAGPISAAILASASRSMAGTAGGVSSLFRTLGFSLGPALGALAWSLSGGGTTALRTGALLLVALATLASATVMALRTSRSSRPGSGHDGSSDEPDPATTDSGPGTPPGVHTDPPPAAARPAARNG
ncbi:MFS transporter [Phytoactinopolyspora halophila]|nr:MFS transporter [Phytoactinopolyspora halophila]